MRLKLNKITDIKEIKLNQTLLNKDCYPVTVECIDGNDGSMKVYVKCLLNKTELNYDFEFIKNNIKKGNLFEIIELDKE